MSINVLSSRIGREIFLLASLIASVPLVGVSLFSMSTVYRAFDDRNSEYLEDIAETYGRTVLDRLNLLASFAQADQSVALPLIDSTQTATTARLDETGALVFARSDISVAILEQAQRVLGPTLAFDRSTRVAVPVLLLPDTAGVSIVTVSPDYLWGAPSDYPYGVDICAIAADASSPVYCSAPLAHNIVSQIVANTLHADVIVADNDGAEMKSAYWDLFVPSAFDGPVLRLVASQPTRIVGIPWQSLRTIYILATIAMLAAVALIAAFYARRFTGPIEALRKIMKRIADGDLAARSDLTRRDEFQELADATNSMATSLGRQLDSLKMVADTDRMILSAASIDTIIDAVLRKLVASFACHGAMVIQIDPDGDDVAVVHAQSAHVKDVKVERVSLQGEDLQQLWMHEKRLSVIERRQLSIAHLLGDRALSVDSLILQGVYAGGRVCAVIVVAPEGTIQPPLDEIADIAESADRLAVAFEFRRREQELVRRATVDTLTGLPNRQLLLDRLEQELIRARTYNRPVAVCFIDIDGFKQVNDTLGHAGGDDLLRQAAQRLSRCVGETETVARLGGDEFVILLPGGKLSTSVEQAMSRVLEAMARPFVVQGSEIFLSASIGIASFPHDDETSDGLLRKADTAMYGAKSSGRGQILHFDDDMDDAIAKRLEMESELRYAIEREQLKLLYQPQFRVSGLRVIGAEALLRWVHPERGIVSPADFIPVAEESGFIRIIGAWVMSTACRQMREWRDQGVPVERVAVNVSAHQFNDPEFVAKVADCVELNQIEPSWLELELTESVFMGHVDEAKRKFQELREFGVSIALDDFGTGYSSLSYLKELPIDIVKIDRSFVAGLPHDLDACAIVSAIAILAQTLGIEVVGEGIETNVQLNYLRDLHIAIGQGYLIGKPMESDAMAQLAFEKNDSPARDGTG